MESDNSIAGTTGSTALSSHRWHFQRISGFDQVCLQTGSDIARLGELDQKLWVALSCPVSGLNFDAATLALIDHDHDGHIRAPELLAAVNWLGSLLNDEKLLVAGTDPLPLSAINQENEEARRLLASIQEILKAHGKHEETALGCADTAGSVQAFAALPFNGDGIITQQTTDDEKLRILIGEIIETLGGETDKSGEPGINQEKLDRFFTEASDLHAWRQQMHQHTAALPSAIDYQTAYAAFSAVSEKIDDFFTRCRLAAFDNRAMALLNGSEADLQELAAENLGYADFPEKLLNLPLAQIAANRELPLANEINPAWEAAIQTFVTHSVIPLLGQQKTLSETDWGKIKACFNDYAQWTRETPVTSLTALDPARIEEILKSTAQEKLSALIAQDAARAPEAEALAAVDRLVRYARDLPRLLNNFVTFRDFYGRRQKAIFQAGTLYLDGRSCDLVMPVIDADKHAALATRSGIYLVYCDCTRSGEKRSIVAAITAGDCDQIIVGRNGVYYDYEGRDWDATVTKIVDHPISIRQAFFAPYKKAARFLSEQIQKFSASKSQEVDNKASAGVTGSVGTATAAPATSATPAAAPATPAATAPAKPAFDIARFAGIFAAIGLAIGAIGAACASIVTGFLNLVWWQMPLAILGILLLISAPSVITAIFKLRNRNLGPLLDANGWAVNTRALINIPFGATLTQLARIPENAEKNLSDPYSGKQDNQPEFFAPILAAAIFVAFLFWISKTPIS